MIRGLIPGRGKEIFSSAKDREHHCSAPSLLLNWVAGVPCPWVQYQACETDHSSPSSIGQETVELYLYSPSNQALYSRDNITFTWLSVFMSEPLHAPSLNLLLYKGFDNENVQLNYIFNPTDLMAKIT